MKRLLGLLVLVVIACEAKDTPAEEPVNYEKLKSPISRFRHGTMLFKAKLDIVKQYYFRGRIYQEVKGNSMASKRLTPILVLLADYIGKANRDLEAMEANFFRELLKDTLVMSEVNMYAQLVEGSAEAIMDPGKIANYKDHLAFKQSVKRIVMGNARGYSWRRDERTVTDFIARQYGRTDAEFQKRIWGRVNRTTVGGAVIRDIHDSDSLQNILASHLR